MQLIAGLKEHCKITRVSNFTKQAIDTELAITVNIRKAVKFFCLLKKVLLFLFWGTGSHTMAQAVLGHYGAPILRQFHCWDNKCPSTTTPSFKWFSYTWIILPVFYHSLLYKTHYWVSGAQADVTLDSICTHRCRNNLWVDYLGKEPLWMRVSQIKLLKSFTPRCCPPFSPGLLMVLGNMCFNQHLLDWKTTWVKTICPKLDWSHLQGPAITILRNPGLILMW